MKKAGLIFAGVSLMFLTGCGPWKDIASWNKAAVVSITGNEYINKTQNTIDREAKSGIASVKGIVHEVGGEATMHNYRGVFVQCVDFTHNKLGNFDALTLMTPQEVVGSTPYGELTLMTGGPEAKTKAGQKMLEVVASATAPQTITEQGYKHVSDAAAQELLKSMGIDGAITFDVDFKYDLVGVGTSGSAKGVADLKVALHYKDAAGQPVITSLGYRGISDGKCDVKTGGFYKGEEMEPLLVQAYEAALNNFINTAQTELAEVRAKESAKM